ncbi:MAG TPA: hypothetical protein VMD59_23375 [Acidimicrobiales bacterium]|nr:hypothetical protein [Acidimicrobiales bacterium]
MHDGELDARPTRRSRCRLARLLVPLAVGTVSLLAAACSGSPSSAGVANLGSTLPGASAGGSPAQSSGPAQSAGTAQSSGTAQGAGPAGNSGTATADQLAYAKCMRSHGLSDFPDPNAQGGFSAPAKLDPSSPQYLSAQQACQSLAGGGPHLSPAKEEQMEARLLEFAQCMRTHGEPGYPDPKFSAGGVTQSIEKGSGIDPTSPQFQAAQRTCQAERTAANP